MPPLEHRLFLAVVLVVLLVSDGQRGGLCEELEHLQDLVLMVQEQAECSGRTVADKAIMFYGPWVGICAYEHLFHGSLDGLRVHILHCKTATQPCIPICLAAFAVG